jgi:hypothetical protein
MLQQRSTRQLECSGPTFSHVAETTSRSSVAIWLQNSPELIDDNLCAVRKIAKLRLPDSQGFDHPGCSQIRIQERRIQKVDLINAELRLPFTQVRKGVFATVSDQQEWRVGG